MADLDWAERVAISVPMHTATRLADDVISVIEAYRADLPVATYGLYAGVGDADVAGRLEGEYEPGLIDWVADPGNGATRRHLGRSDFATPERSGLPGLDRYARLEHDGKMLLVGAIEATHGCRHRCRHCPIPTVYDGRIRIVPADEVLADIDNLVAAGAQHVTFGDPDFLNAPAHTVAILERAHRAHPGLTFDVTVKVEHILEHSIIWPDLADLGLLFVVSAFESVDDETLQVLDKGHTRADLVTAIGLTRAAGIHLRPTWLPFLPWSSLDDVADIFEFIATNDLAGATDPVQLTIRLLIPKGSLLEEHPVLAPYLVEYDSKALSWRWRFEDPEVEVLHKELEAIAAEASDCGREAGPTLEAMRISATRMSGRDLPPLHAAYPVPRLTESWFCCAEPTGTQTVRITAR